MISSMKVAAAIRSKPVTIFLFRVTPRGCRRRSNLEDRIHPTLSARVPSTFQGVCIPGRLHSRTSAFQDVCIPGRLHSRASAFQGVCIPGRLPFKETPNGLSGLAARASASAASRCQRSAASRIISELEYGANESRHRGDAWRLPPDRWFEFLFPPAASQVRTRDQLKKRAGRKWASSALCRPFTISSATTAPRNGDIVTPLCVTAM
jgi:hypothetical protein